MRRLVTVSYTHLDVYKRQVLYWITNNVLTIAQQAFINSRMGVPVKFSVPSFK